MWMTNANILIWWHFKLLCKRASRILCCSKCRNWGESSWEERGWIGFQPKALAPFLVPMSRMKVLPNFVKIWICLWTPQFNITCNLQWGKMLEQLYHLINHKLTCFFWWEAFLVERQMAWSRGQHTTLEVWRSAFYPISAIYLLCDSSSHFISVPPFTLL